MFISLFFTQVTDMEELKFIKHNKNLGSKNEENIFLLNESNLVKEEDLPSTSSYKSRSDDYKTDCVQKITKNFASNTKSK